MLINNKEYNVIDVYMALPVSHFRRHARTALEFRHLTDCYYTDCLMTILFEANTEGELMRKSAVITNEEELVYVWEGITHHAIIQSVKTDKAFKDYMTGKYVMSVELKQKVFRKYGATKSGSPNNGTLPSQPVFTINVTSATTSITVGVSGHRVTVNGDFKAGDTIIIDTEQGFVKLNGAINMGLLSANADFENCEIPVGSFTMPSFNGSYSFKERYL